MGPISYRLMSDRPYERTTYERSSLWAMVLMSEVVWAIVLCAIVLWAIVRTPFCRYAIYRAKVNGTVSRPTLQCLLCSSYAENHSFKLILWRINWQNNNQPAGRNSKNSSWVWWWITGNHPWSESTRIAHPPLLHIRLLYFCVCNIWHKCCVTLINVHNYPKILILYRSLCFVDMESVLLKLRKCISRRAS